MTEKKEKCFICQRPAIQEFQITIDDGGKLHENQEKEKTYICKIHLREFQNFKKKKRGVDFH